MTNKNPGLIKRFFLSLLKGYRLFRSIILNVLFVLIVVLIVSSMLGTAPPIVPKGAALIIAPNGIIVEQKTLIDPIENILNGSISTTGSAEILLQDILDAIHYASNDTSISSIVLQPGALQAAGFSKLQDIGLALTSFKNNGKKVYAMADNFTQGQYYLASYADEILLNPYGSVILEGFSNYQMYYADALEKLGVNMHIFRVGEFKSAVEPYERNNMSESAKVANNAWLNDLWQIFVEDINHQRNLSDEIIANYTNTPDQQLARYNGDTAQLALKSGLVDLLADRSETNAYLINAIGSDASASSFSNIDLQAYLYAKRAQHPIEQYDNDKVAIIVASGTIYDGSQSTGSIGSDSLSALIKRARDDASIKALVLRIDSPGGSAFASEIIRSELLQFKAIGKTLVVSMGSVAASGGYWIASPADQIWASPATITGSIGIFGIYPSFEKTLNTLGINADGVGTTNVAGAFTVGKSLPTTVADAQQQVVQHGYNRFLRIVADGRNMSIENVDAIAQGRVWSGLAALQLGLVDQLGNLNEAVIAAAELAQLEDYQTEVLEAPLSPSEMFFQEVSQNFTLQGLFKQSTNHQPTINPIKQFYQQVQTDIEQLIKFNDPQGMYLQCFECSSI